MTEVNLAQVQAHLHAMNMVASNLEVPVERLLVALKLLTEQTGCSLVLAKKAGVINE